MRIYYDEKYGAASNNKLFVITYKTIAMFDDWRDTFIKAFNEQVQFPRHKCPRIVLQGEPNTGKTSFVNFLFGNNFNKKLY